MHAIRQQCRPKHQVLILKCYPRTTKGAVDVKPNSSELSYLLYYATTRRSKVQKVGAFLEKKTASDAWRARIGNVQVTLQILAALIEKSPRDLPLYAPYVLKILNLILGSDDITMIESSIPTFEAFCEHHDGASLSADQGYLRQYEEIVRKYASFASTRPIPTKTPRSAPVEMRWRVAGLKAVKSVASSEALASLAGRQLDVVVPILLENLWTDNNQYLVLLQQRAQLEAKIDVERLLRRRTSVATVRTVESETNVAAVSGTTADADKLAEEDIGVLAIQCLSKIFTVNNRPQVRGATISIIKFITDRVAQNEEVTNINGITGEDRGWATTVFMMIARWTPVQDRYMILVTTMDSLVRSPLTEENLPQQLVLATMIGSLLRSDINLIGLSVMDVLLGLIQHVLRMLQLGNVDPHLQQRTAAGEFTSQKGFSKEPSPSSSLVGAPLTEVATLPPSTPRKELLARLQQCIGDLATHVYYADQISDMISAILLRLKPSPQSGIATVAAAIEDPGAANNAISTSANMIEGPDNDGFFSFDTAKVTALKAIKTIILVATKRNKLSSGASLGRNRVGLRVWEGTQWLLRDPNGNVRKAYVDALLTWLEREMTKADLEALEEKPLHYKGLIRNSGDDSTISLTKRAVSNTSHRERPSKVPKTSFMELLHLAVYENSLQFIDFDSDIILLHLLLTTLVNKLGVNAVKSGLPMIFRLQEDIQEAETAGKIRMGSLCHGYFWALSEKFDFESSSIGIEIHSEIVRRRNKGIWVDMVRCPPVNLESIKTPGSDSPRQLPIPLRELEHEALKPYDDRLRIVQLIAVAYSELMISPPNSPPTSPGRALSHPILSGGSPVITETQTRTLPLKTRDQMLSDWSKEDVIAGAREGSKTVSLNGSKAGTGSAAGPRNFLAVNGNGNGATHSGTASPHSQHHQPRRSRPSSQTQGIAFVQKLQKTSLPGMSPAALSDSSRNSITRVDHLKRVLSGQAPASQVGQAMSDTSSESMVSYEPPHSEFSFDNRSPVTGDINNRIAGDRPRSKSRDRIPAAGEHLRPLSSNPVLSENLALASEGDGDVDVIPPVPEIPHTLSLPGAYPESQEKVPTLATSSLETHGSDSRVGRTSSRGLRDKGGTMLKGVSWPNEGGDEVIDLQTLLKGINTGKDSQMGQGYAGRPPY